MLLKRSSDYLMRAICAKKKESSKVVSSPQDNNHTHTHNHNHNRNYNTNYNHHYNHHKNNTNNKTTVVVNNNNKTQAKSEVTPADAQILLETFEEKIFICNPDGMVILSSIGNRAKGKSVEEAISFFHAIPHSYSVTLKRCIALVLQSSQKLWFQTPLLDYDQQHSSNNVNISLEMTTSIKPFRKLAGSDSASVAISIAFSEPQLNSNITLDKNAFELEGTLSAAMDSAAPNEPTYSFSLDGVFRSIAKTLAETFQMRYGWVSRIVETAPWRTKIVALWDDKKQEFYSENLEFDLEGSVWGLVGQNEGPIIYTANAKSLFPTDLIISKFGIESLLFSNAKIGSDHSTFMWIGAMHTSPTTWQQPPALKSLLTVLTLRAEEQLSKLKKQHHYWMSDQVLKQMSDAVIILDTTGKVVQWKGTAEQVFGIKTDEARGTSMESLFAEQESFTEFNEWLLKATSRIGIFEPEKDYMKREIKMRKKDGLFDGEISAKVIRLDLPILVLIVVRDITERIKTHEELRTLCALLEKSRDDALAGIRMKSLFLANVSHEIRTPMNAIIGMTQLLLDTQLSSHQSQLVDDIRISGDHLIAIINDILDISKLEAGKVVLDSLPIYILKCIEDAYRLTSRSFPNSQVKFEYLIAPGVPESILGDPTRMTQILINLLSNAMKFTQKGFILVSVCLATPKNVPMADTTVIATPQFSQLALSSAAAGISATTQGVEDDSIELLFTIRDSGIGIPSEALARIFEPFEQSDTASTRKYGGTGLGLSICARLVQCMGGKIWAESEKDKGSTFSFTIAARKLGEVNVSEVRGALNLTLLQQQKTPSPSTLSPRSIHHQSVSAQIQNAIGLKAVSPSSSPTAILPLTQTPFLLSSSASPLSPPSICGSASPVHSSPDSNNSSPVGKPEKQETKSVAVKSSEKPVERPAEKAIEKPVGKSNIFPAPIPEHARLSILVAEDNAMNQKVILMLLSKIGCEADLACNGVEAVAAAEKKHYDLILMDVQMPEMDGIEATSRISKMKPHPNELPPVIIALTANVCEQDQIVRYHNAGMVHILAKPVKLTLLQEVLSNLPSFREVIREREEKKKLAVCLPPLESLLITPTGSPRRQYISVMPSPPLGYSQMPPPVTPTVSAPSVPMRESLSGGNLNENTATLTRAIETLTSFGKIGQIPPSYSASAPSLMAFREKGSTTPRSKTIATGNS